MRNKEDRNDEYWKTLSIRLVEERNASEKFSTQQQLADETGISREKINYAELNITGRTLQINELARIAKTLDVSMDYLVGLSQSKTSAISNGLTDDTNKIIHKWGPNTLKLIDTFMRALNEGILNSLKDYLSVAYYIRNAIADELDNIESKVNEGRKLSNIEVQKISYLVFYIDYLMNMKAMEDEYVQFLVEKHKKTILAARVECEHIVYYTKYTDTDIDFERIRAIKEIFTTFESYLQYKLESQLKTSIDNMVTEVIKDSKFFYEIKKFTDEQYNSKQNQ